MVGACNKQRWLAKLPPVAPTAYMIDMYWRLYWTRELFSWAQVLMPLSSIKQQGLKPFTTHTKTSCT